ncbi:MAG: LacI family DNA-binding transcriptional regulator [Treponema sp.]|jgi:LacI family transcriptional regulator|nr:LacI family DNA-binding transcriptional regulator [Treponema sp.]
MKLSIKKLSELSGFSPATVSNALNHKRGVSKETIEKILSLSRQYGYVGRPQIKGIRLVVYKREGLVVSDTPFFQQLIDGVSAECRNLGFQTGILYLERFKDDFDEHIQSVLRDPDSAILLLDTEMHREDIEPFKAAVAPVLLLDGWFDDMGIHTVTINNTDSVFGAVERLVQKGHREIGYLKGNIRIRNFFYREMGYRRALYCAGLPLHDDYTVSLGTTPQSAYEDMLGYLDAGGGKKLPTAYFADNDIIALGAMKALIERGVRIPEDVSVVGFDDLPFADMFSPALSTIRVNKREMGRAAVRQLVSMIKSPNEVTLKIEVSTDYVERGSVGPPLRRTS